MLASLEPIEQDFGAATVQARFGVSAKTAREWLERWREAGDIEPSRPDAKEVRDA